jgi:general secretion pathway protein C
VKRWVPAVAIGSSAALAGVLAIVTNAVIGQVVALPEGAELEEPVVAESSSAAAPRESVASRPRTVSKDQYIRDILGRNIFDHTQIGKAAASGDGTVEITDLKLRLVATLVAVPTRFSSAMIADDAADGVAHGYGEGSKIKDATIVSIEQRMIRLKRGDGREEILRMDEDAAPAPATESRVETSSSEDTIEGIEKLGENRYAVDRSIIAKYLTDLDALSKMARAIPHRGPDGNVDGYRLSGIRRGSPLDQLGVKNGDIVHGVNGTGLSSPQGAMGAFSSLQSESNFNFEITRRGQKSALEYEVR